MVQTANENDWIINGSLNTLDMKSLPREKNAENFHKNDDQLRKEILAFYFYDYYSAWFKFLKSIRIEHFNSLSDAANQLLILSNPSGPLAQLIHALDENKIINGSYQNNNIYLNDLLKNYLYTLTAVANDLQRLSESTDTNRDAQKYAARILSGSGNDLGLYRSAIAVNLLVNQFNNIETQSILREVLLQPIRESWGVVLEAAMQNLEQDWRNEVINNYKMTIADRFPFNHFSIIDGNLSDVNNFFAPKQGIFWTFVNTYLKPYLYFDGNYWHKQKWLGVGARFSKKFLDVLTQTRQISNSLFEINSQLINFNYHIYPIPTPGISKILFTVGGTRYAYHNGPQEWEKMYWPGNHPDKGSELTANTVQGMSPPTLQAQGAWGLFHLIMRGHIIFEGDGIYKIRWTLLNDTYNYHITLILRLSNKNDVIQALLLNQYILPEEMFS